MKLTLRVWRQSGPDAPGDFETYEIDNATEEMSFSEIDGDFRGCDGGFPRAGSEVAGTERAPKAIAMPRVECDPSLGP